MQGRAWWSEPGKMVKPINPILASISLAVQRIYSSMDNPYTGVIAFLMLTWTVHKISMFERVMHPFFFATHEDVKSGVQQVPFAWGRFSDILFDCFIVAVMLYTGIVLQVRVKTYNGFSCVSAYCVFLECAAYIQCIFHVCICAS